jgi:hypothetical protein
VEEGRSERVHRERLPFDTLNKVDPEDEESLVLKLGGPFLREELIRKRGCIITICSILHIHHIHSATRDSFLSKDQIHSDPGVLTQPTTDIILSIPCS